MENYICETCGVQYDASASAPEICLICSEERQYVNPKGQSWTTLSQLAKVEHYHNHVTQDESGVFSIQTKPSFAIGQTAYLIQSEKFNVLWDCITYLDSQTIEVIKSLGGIQAIALSHPHYYSTQVEWAETFDAPIYIHEDDRQWVTRPSAKIIFWSGETHQVHDGFILHRLGGHFKGAAVLQWQRKDELPDILFSGDIVRVTPDGRWATFMYSYPNFIPLPASTVQRMAKRMKEIEFECLYDAFHRIMEKEANERIQNSADRYVAALNGELFTT